MKRVFRFQVDLTRTDVPTEAQAADPELLRELELEKAFSRLAAATLEPSEFEDPLTAQELLQAYNGALRRAQSVELGRYIQNQIDHHVFFDDFDNKHVVTQSQQARGERISELLMGSDGNLLRFSLERRSGTLMELGNLMVNGISELSEDFLRGAPGYWLVTTRFYREGNDLVSVEQSQTRYNTARREFEQLQDVMLG